MTHKLITGTLLALVLTVTGLACAQEAGPEPRRPAVGHQDANHYGALGAYRIGPEDVLQIAVWKDDAISRSVPVRPDGMISLPLLNDVRAAGLTPFELRDVLMKKLAEYMPSPDVSVIVTDVRSFKVSVIGEVKRPARYDLKSWATVLDVLAEAGGFTQFAARSSIVVLRPEGKTVKRIPFNYNQVVSAHQENFYLRPGDIVLVP